MKRFAFPLAILLLTAGMSGPLAYGREAAGSSATKDTEALIKQECRLLLVKEKIPGLVVAVSGPGLKNICACGKARQERSIPVTEGTLFPLASITKLFVAKAVLELSRQGRLNLGDSITKWLADAPASWSDIKIEHLLTHSSGLPDPSVYTTKKASITLANLACQSRLFEPGKQNRYNNTAYVLLGRIVEKASGQSLGTALKSLAIDTNKMPSTGLPSRAQYERLADGYRLTGFALRRCDPLPQFSLSGGSGGMISCGKDMSAWVDAIKSETDGLPFAPSKINPGTGSYTLGGWEVEKNEVFRKRGNFSGYSTLASIYTRKDTAIVVLCNRGNVDLVPFCDRINSILANRKSKP